MFDEIIAPLFNTKWGRRLGLGMLILVIILLVMAIISLFSGWYDDFILTRNHHVVVKPTSNEDEVSSRLAQITKQHLFGQSAVGGVLPITSLQLRLIGVIKAEPEKYSRVIISEGNRPGKVYQINDSLVSGVRIYSITDEGVVLENGGQLEKLPLQRPRLLFQGAPKPLLPVPEE